MNQYTDAMAVSVKDALRELLSEKHLYQNVEVDLSLLQEAANDQFQEWKSGNPHAPTHVVQNWNKQIEDDTCLVKIGIWFPNGADNSRLTESYEDYVQFSLPTINAYCETCKSKQPFKNIANEIFYSGYGPKEAYYLGYQCQNCDHNPIRFLVCRDKLKLRLAGRYPIEVMPMPDSLPKSVSKYYSNAIIAHHAGQTLAGLFLLRVFIEQFWRTIHNVKDVIAKQPKATGDEQGSAYQETLPQDFKSRFPSLRDIYDKLSIAIHSADANAELFDDTCLKIVEHFEARKLFKIAVEGTPSLAAQNA